MSNSLSGRCFCGAVKWWSDGPVLWSGICHCESCRRANSAPTVPFFGVPRDALTMDGPIKIYGSSPGVERGFCPTCGTQMIYRADIWPDETHLMAMTLDDPDTFTPQAHYHWAERVAITVSTDDLPKYAGSEDSSDPV